MRKVLGIGNRVRSLQQRLVNDLKNALPQPRGIAYVSDGSNWSFYWDAHYITKGLGERHQIRTQITTDPWNLRNQIIQFGDRYAFLNGPRESLHKSNTTHLTWFHGEPDDPNEAIRRLFDELPAAMEQAEKVVVTCTRSRDVLANQGIAEQKIVQIPLGVDVQTFHPASPEDRKALRTQLGFHDDTFVIGSFQKDGAGWGDGNEPKMVKGPDTFLQVVERAAATHKNIAVLLTGPARGYVKSGLERLKVPYAHKMFDDYLDIVPYYQALDAYLICSRSEGGPKSLLESWATGIPVVSTRMGMPADLINDGTDGHLADIDDVDKLAENLCKLIEDRDHAKALGDAGRQTSLAYDWNQIADAYYEKLYRPYLQT